MQIWWTASFRLSIRTLRQLRRELLRRRALAPQHKRLVVDLRLPRVVLREQGGHRQPHVAAGPGLDELAALGLAGVKDELVFLLFEGAAEEAGRGRGQKG